MSTLNIGMVGLDTSHVGSFIDILNDSNNAIHLEGGKVVKAFPGGSKTFSNSYNRVEKYTEETRAKGVEIVSSIEDLAGLDAYFLESVDGTQHLEQFRVLAEFGKPVFIDKPLACCYEDAKAIFDLAAAKNVPIFTASGLRYAIGCGNVQPVEGEKLEAVDAYGPMALLPDYRDVFWYGIHTVEILYSHLGRGCQRVRVVRSGSFDLLIGEWEGDRLGVAHGVRKGCYQFAVRLFTDKRNVFSTQDPAFHYIRPLTGLIVDFFRTGKSPVDPSESLETIAFLEAASRSAANGGAAVALASL